MNGINRLIPFIYTYPSDVSSEWLHTLIVFLLSYPKKGLIMQINQPIKSCCLNLVTVTYKCYLTITVLLFACCVLPTLTVTCVIHVWVFTSVSYILIYAERIIHLMWSYQTIRANLTFGQYPLYWKSLLADSYWDFHFAAKRVKTLKINTRK